MYWGPKTIVINVTTYITQSVFQDSVPMAKAKQRAHIRPAA